MGSAEGRDPSKAGNHFAKSLRVPLRYKFFPLPDQEGGMGMVGGVFQRPVRAKPRKRDGLSESAGTSKAATFEQERGTH